MKRRGFTLLEVLITIGLMLVLVGTMTSFLMEVLATREQTLEIGRRQLAATTLLRRLEIDLMTVIAADRGEAGIAGDESRIAVMCRSVPASRAERGIDAPEVFADLERAEYRFDDGALLARRALPGETPPALVSISDLLHRVRFRYHDGEAWRGSFDSRAAGRLPVAVEVAVWFEDPEGAKADDDGPREPTDDAGLDTDMEPALDDEGDDLDEPVELESDAGEPAPDRLRVIVIADHAPPSDEDVEMSAEGGP